MLALGMYTYTKLYSWILVSIIAGYPKVMTTSKQGMFHLSIFYSEFSVFIGTSICHSLRAIKIDFHSKSFHIQQQTGLCFSDSGVFC